MRGTCSETDCDSKSYALHLAQSELFHAVQHLVYIFPQTLMSYLQTITTDMTDECLNLLLQNSMGDQWWSLNDLQQSQLLSEAYEYCQALCDQQAINELLAVQPRFSSTPRHWSPLPTHSFFHPHAAPLPLNPLPAMQPTMPSAQQQSCTPVLTDDLTFCPSFYRAYTMAEYTWELFKHMATHDHAVPHPMLTIPLELPYSMIKDAHHIAELAGRAYHNPRMS